jgi:hypothetical protein
VRRATHLDAVPRRMGSGRPGDGGGPSRRRGGRCNASASFVDAVSQASTSAWVVRMTGMALGWMALTSAFGSVVKKANRSLVVSPSLTLRTDVPQAGGEGPAGRFSAQERPFLKEASSASARPGAQHSSQAIERRERRKRVIPDCDRGRRMWVEAV